MIQKFYNSLELKLNQKKENIIYLTPEWPNYDKSSGGLRSFEILKILNKKFNVYYFTQDLSKQKYKEELEKVEIKVFNESIEENLTKLKNINFEYAILCWWYAAEVYLEKIKLIFPNIKIITDSVDIHWVRESRGGIGSEEKKTREKLVYEKSDHVIVVTEEDRKSIEKECNVKNIKLISNIHEEKFEKFKKGNDIMFLGGFSHTPNVDAAIRSYDIYNKFVKETGTKCKLYIVGNNPPEIIKGLNRENVVVTGCVENISEYFEKSKVFISPLNWGAGIKGKICEAVMHKVPVLTNEIGNEGFNFNNFEECFIAKNDREFIESLKLIYNIDENLLSEISNKAYNKIKNFISPGSAEKTLNYLLSPKPQVVVSIVTYKNEKLLNNCLESISKNTTYKNYIIAITDNDNSTNNVEKIVSKYKNTVYIKNNMNEFFSKPNNKIVSRYNSADIILLNDDVEVTTEGWIEILQEAAYYSGDIACSGGMSLSTDRRLEEAGSILFNNGKGLNIGRSDDPEKKQYNQRETVGYCSGCMLYMKRSALNQVGVLDESFYPMYYEDSDWQYRAHIIGLKTIYEPKCKYIHKGMSSSKGKALEYMETCRNIFVDKYKNIDIEKYNHVSKWKAINERF